MGLEQMKACSLLFKEDAIVIRGKCKESLEDHFVRLSREAYDKWQDGIPLSYAAPELSKTEVRFLNTGIWR